MGMDFHPNSVFGADSGFEFGFRFCVHKDFTRFESAPLPSSVLPDYQRDTYHRRCFQTWLMVLPNLAVLSDSFELMMSL
jgi:hypothetical protein